MNIVKSRSLTEVLKKRVILLQAVLVMTRFMKNKSFFLQTIIMTRI